MLLNMPSKKCTLGLGREAGMLKAPADVDLDISDGGGARMERVSGRDCLNSSDALSLSSRKVFNNTTNNNN